MTGTITYTTEGSIRGSCGHRHRSIETAQKCVERDRRACASLAGGAYYSDRCVVRSDGSWLDEEGDDPEAGLRDIGRRR